MHDLRIPRLLAAYRSGELTPNAMLASLLARVPATAAHAIWIAPPDADALAARARELEARGMHGLPLYGVPFAVKDNIDVAGMPTTAACAAFARVAERHAPVVQTLLDAGAICVGKTNLDQFATGLNGTRSDYGVCRNAFDPAYLSGGSSSGSAVAVALGLASFALGTDTAGSGRVPAAFNNLIGFKPTRGRLSTEGVLPACRSLDCVSVFALDSADAASVFDLAATPTPGDAWQRTPPAPLSRTRPLPGFGVAGRTIAVPQSGQLDADCDADTLAAFARSKAALTELGASLIEIDLTPFLQTARLLYEGPWVAERYTAIRAFFDAHADAVHPVVREIIAHGKGFSAWETFDAAYRLVALRRAVEHALTGCDALLLPTTPTHFRIDEVLADPVMTNTRLGRYTNFVNLLDFCAVAVPAGLRANGLPVGVTLLAPAFDDHFVLGLAAQLQPQLNTFAGHHCCAVDDFHSALEPPDGSYALAVVGAHMSGLALNHELTTRGARLLRRTLTAARYRFYALPGRIPRPGLVAVAPDATDPGAAIEAEVWAIPAAELGSFLAGIPAPLGLGKVTLDDDREVIGFICEGAGVTGATDITAWGGWRAWLARAST